MGSSSGYDGYQAGDKDNSIGRTQSRMRHCLRLHITHVDGYYSSKQYIGNVAAYMHKDKAVTGN
jgi:hypothetical protein